MIRFLLTAALFCGIALANLCYAQWTQLPGQDNDRCISMHANDTYIFAGTRDRGILRTSDFGQTWEPINSGLPDSIYPHVIYQDGDRLFLGTDRGGFVSTNMGETWQSIPAGGSWHVVEFRRYGRYIFMAGDSARLYRSMDGTTWHLANAGISNDRAVYVLASDAKHLYAGIYGGAIYRSADSGITWAAVPNNEKFGEGSVFDMVAGDGFVIAAVSTSSLVLSTDTGETWELVTPKVPRVGMSTSMYSMIMYQGGLYIGGDGYFFRSMDLGRTWDTVMAGLRRPVTIENISVTSTHMVLGTPNAWIWVRPLSEVLPPASIDATISPYALRLEQSRPNPAGSMVHIPYTLTSAGRVELKLYNGASQEIALLVDEHKEAGEHSAIVDVSDLPDGTYYYRLSVDGSSLTRRMVVVK